MPPTEKLSITLPHDMASMVREKVESGDYASNSEVIREALRLLQEQEALRAQKLAWLREKIVEGEASGEPLPAEEVFDRLEARYAAMIAKQEK
ncbi:type II toxin-antitoxin system ParD family antitoxin [Geminicoccaceae bacterium 1502E]|nr:type II toxin-antitoxin system ParD family antitoxin [Geminicoccaceae bacterium 1502E]